MKNNLVLLLDFDRTLFNTDNFLSSIKNIFKEIGVSDNLFISSYKEIKPYNIKDHLALLNLNTKNRNLALEKTNDLFNNAKKNLFPDTIRFLQFFKKNKIKNILVSFGDEKFQKDKIEKSGIKNLLDAIYITRESKNKKDIYKKIIEENKGKEIIIIDDLPENTKNIIDNIPGIKAIKIDRKANQTKKNISKNYYEVKNLDQIVELISQL